MSDFGILVILSGTAGTAACLSITSLASPILGRPPITVLHVRAAPGSTILPSEEVLGSRDIAAINSREAAEDAAIAEMVGRWNETDATWRSVAGYEVDEIRDIPRDIRLVVLPHPGLAPPGHQQALDAVLFAARRPVLMVPPAMPAPIPAFCRHLAIGWRDTPITRRALDAFAPFVEAAGKVTVVAVVEGESSSLQSARAAIGPRRTDAAFKMIDPAGGGTGAALLGAASRAGADTLLIGAHRHGALQRWILGTVTGVVVRRTPVPVLLSA